MTTEVKTQEAPAGGSEVQFDLETCSLEQFHDKLKNDVDFMNDFMENANDPKYKRVNDMQDKKIPDVAAAPAAAPAQQGAAGGQVAQPQGAQPPAAPAEEEVELTGIKIPKQLFGSYLSDGRSVGDAITEALKGNAEKDKTIKSFRDRNDVAINDNLNLRRQLIIALQKNETAQQSVTDAQQAGAAQLQQILSAVREIDFSALDDVDPLDPDSHPKIETAKGTLAKLKKVFESQQAAQPAAGQQPSALPAQPGGQPPATPELKKTRQELVDSVTSMEFADIDALQAAVPELRTTVPFQTLDKAVWSFQQSVAQAAGTPGNIQGALDKYFAGTPEGEQFRAACKTLGTEVPEGYEKHQFIIGKIRPLRLKNIENYRTVVKSKTGKDLEPWETLDAPGISYKDLYRNVEPYKPPTVPPVQPGPGTQPSPKMQQAIEQHRAENMPGQQTVPEIPPSMGIPPNLDIGKLPESEVNALITKLVTTPDAITKEEAQSLQKIYEFAKVPVHEAVIKKLKE